MAKQSNSLWLILATLPVVLLLAYQNGLQQFLSTSPAVDRSKIGVVYAGITATSHLEKAQPLIAGLVRAGYPVTFITGEEHRNTSLATGAHYEPLDGPYTFAYMEDVADYFANPDGEDTKLATLIFTGYLPDFSNTLQRVLRQMRSQYEKVVYIHDTSFMGLLPVQLGAPGILPTISIGLGISNLALDSVDTYPFQSGLVPDTTDNARRLHRQQNANPDKKELVTLNKNMAEALKKMGAIEPYPNFFHAFGGYDEYIAQVGLPEFEFKRTDMVPKVKFLGIPNKPGGSRELPVWWQDVLDAEAAGKKIIVVTQGSASFDLNRLIVPTIQAFAERDDVLVIATTVTAGPDIPGFTPPSNARLAQYIPFDLLFQHTSILVSTGGYGAVLQSINAGVPLILAGQLQDKAQVAAIAESVGVAVNLRTETPSIETIQSAVARVLGDDKTSGDPSYRANCLRIRDANKRYGDPVKALDGLILQALEEKANPYSLSY